MKNNASEPTSSQTSFIFYLFFTRYLKHILESRLNFQSHMIGPIRHDDPEFYHDLNLRLLIVITIYVARSHSHLIGAHYKKIFSIPFIVIPSSVIFMRSL